MNHIYLCIDLKSFYASVECVARGLDPMTTNLVVADSSRTEKTICLAVSPALKALGVKNRCRVFEIPKHINYIMATPRMQEYINVSASIYAIYLKYISKDDIHVYSIDEAFLDITNYLSLYHMSAKELAVMIMDDIYQNTGITATAGIGTNMYLTKIALDITAKHVDDHIGYLDEELFRKTLWDHQPLTDFWRIGKGIAKHLAQMHIYTMRQLAYYNEDELYRQFGIDAELLIDHAWGRESVTIADIKHFAPKNHSLTSGQVLSRDYSFEEGLIVVKEMAEDLAYELVDARLVTSQISLMLGYTKNTRNPSRKVITLSVNTSSSRILVDETIKLYQKICDKRYGVRRMMLAYLRVEDEMYESYDLFSDQKAIEEDKKLAEVTLAIRKKFGANALLKARDFEKGATAKERHEQIGGHRKGDETWEDGQLPTR